MQKNRIFKEGSAHHLYLKALKGNVLFYRTEDYIFFLTLLSVLARRYGIGIEALCIMFNHVHIFVKAADIRVFKAFCRDLQSIFSKEYNKEYFQKGKLMMRSGYAPKSSSKSVLSCLIYIVNNPVAGHLTKTALEYKWNLLAFFQSDHPFSDRLVKSSCRLRMREAARMVDYCHRQGKQLNYPMLKCIFKDLTPKEKLTITDYIINLYNPIDKESFLKRFGDWNTAVIAFESTTGSEHDVPEAWEDYSIYLNMLRLCLRHKKRPEHFTRMGEDEKLRLVKLLSAVPYSTQEHIRRFLHL
ncbi:MAG: transposase [Bacteroidales bacterium]|nr:transposase [Bacteroidales bacterium]